MLPLTRSRNRARFFGIPFSPSVLFAGGTVAGAWYDPSDLTTLFQDSAGTTPVTGVEQVVGLMLDKSKGLVLGSELAAVLPTPTILDSGGSVGVWDGSTQTISSTTITAITNYPRYQFAIAGVTAGKNYQISVTATGTNLIRISNPSLGGVALIANFASGSLSFIANNVASNVFQLVTDSRAVYSATLTVSIRELPGNHATSTGAARPTLRARYNLLTYSEEFDQGVWTKGNATATNTTATTDPLGGNTADKLASNTASSVDHAVDQTLVINSVTTFTVYAKAAELSRIAIGRTSGPVGKVFDLVAGTAHDLGPTSWSGWTSASAGNFSITSAGNGWWRVSITAPASAVNGRNDIYLIDNNGNERTFATASGNGIYIWGAQLLTAADAFATGNAYQRVAAATVYDTSNSVFRPYLAAGGTQAMQTASINPGAVDKAQVFAGVTNLVGGNSQLVEFSADVNANNGAFSMPKDAVGAGIWTVGLRGTSSISASSAASYSAPITTVNTGRFDTAVAVDAAILRINGTQVGTSGASSPGASNFGTYPLNILARNNGASVPFTGRLYSLITRFGPNLSAAEISATEAWVNQRTGAY
jgi:hypothetical protein